MCDYISYYLTGAQAKIIIQVCNQNIFAIFIKSVSSCSLLFFFLDIHTLQRVLKVINLFTGKLKDAFAFFHSSLEH